MTMTTPRMSVVVARLAHQREKLEAVVAGFDETVAATHPGSEEWPIADHVHHLVVVESGVLQLCRSLVEAAEAEGAPPASPRLSTEDAAPELAELVEPLMRFADVPFKTLPALMPEPGHPVGESMLRLRAVRGHLYTLCAAAAVYDLRGFTQYHYYLREDLDVYRWLLVHAEHEARHTRKIRALAERLR
jgi:hypothetical protein